MSPDCFTVMYGYRQQQSLFQVRSLLLRMTVSKLVLERTKNGYQSGYYSGILRNSCKKNKEIREVHCLNNNSREVRALTLGNKNHTSITLSPIEVLTPTAPPSKKIVRSPIQILNRYLGAPLLIEICNRPWPTALIVKRICKRHFKKKAGLKMVIFCCLSKQEIN